MKIIHRLAGVLLVLLLVLPVCWAQELRVTVSAERAPDGKLTGNYVASIAVNQAAAARQVVFGLAFPTDYGMNTAVNDIRIVAVKPGADVQSIDVSGVQTPVLFGEKTDGTGTNIVWVVALLKDDAQNVAKKVCDIVFTSRGKATVEVVAFQAGSVAVKDGALNALVQQGTFNQGVRVPLFGDLNWDGTINALDFAVFAQAWREYNAAPADKALADFHPRANTSTDPAQMLSTGDQIINALDFAAFALAWREFNKP